MTSSSGAGDSEAEAPLSAGSNWAAAPAGAPDSLGKVSFRGPVISSHENKQLNLAWQKHY